MLSGDWTEWDVVEHPLDTQMVFAFCLPHVPEFKLPTLFSCHAQAVTQQYLHQAANELCSTLIGLRHPRCHDKCPFLCLWNQLQSAFKVMLSGFLWHSWRQNYIIHFLLCHHFWPSCLGVTLTHPWCFCHVKVKPCRPSTSWPCFLIPHEQPVRSLRR